MKLLSPSVIKAGQAQQTERELLRAQEVERLAIKSRKDLANTEADFKQMLLGQRARWERESQEHDTLVLKMTQEVEGLECRKREALVPLEVYKRKAEKDLREASQMLKMAQGRELAIEDTLWLLEDKLDKVGQKEQDLNTLENRLLVKKEAIESQAKDIDAQSKRLSEALIRFNENVKTAEKDIDERKTAIRLRDISQEARDEQFKRREKELSDWAKRLEDERGILERAFARLNPKISPLKKKE